MEDNGRKHGTIRKPINISLMGVGVKGVELHKNLKNKKLPFIGRQPFNNLTYMAHLIHAFASSALTIS